jgi:mRNA interferase RelE/StbE
VSVIWKVKIHRLALSDDFRSISPPDQKIIFRDIQKKLTIDPKGYGQPLLGELKGYWRLRVGDYRVIYKMAQDTVEVLVIKVGIRRDEKVYKDLFYRLKKLQYH